MWKKIFIVVVALLGVITIFTMPIVNQSIEAETYQPERRMIEEKPLHSDSISPYGKGIRETSNMHALMAEWLGLTEEELYMKRVEEGKSIVEIAEAKGINVDELIEKRMTEQKKMLDEKNLTENQKEKILERMEENITAAFNRDTPCPINNRHWGMKAGNRENCMQIGRGWIE